MNPSLSQVQQLLAGLALLVASAGADAGIFRAYLSVHGSDANACTLAAPCRLLPAALAAVNDGGEVWMMDSANFNTAPVLVDKSLTLLAVPGALASIIASSGPALTVSGTAIKVSLRNLQVLNFAAGTSGIVFATGAQLTVDGCEIYGLQDGILASVFNAEIVMKDTTIRDNFNGVNVSGASKVVIDNVQVLNNSNFAIVVSDSTNVSVTASVVSGNLIGIQSQASTGGQNKLAIERSVVRGNASGLVLAATGGPGSRVNLTSRHNSIVSNGIGVDVFAGTTAFSTATLDANLIAGNTVGVQLRGAGTTVAQTLMNNALTFNASDVSGGLTSFAAQ
jgi:hypothetical protein